MKCDHVTHDRSTETFKCNHCGYSKQIYTWQLSHPFALMTAKEEFAQQHAECVSYGDNHYLAALNFKAKLAAISAVRKSKAAMILGRKFA